MGKYKKLAGFLAATGLVGSIAAASTLTNASADPTVSSLVATPGDVTVNFGSPGQNVVVALDDACSAAFKTGQSYTVTATVGTPAVASVTPPVSGALNCKGDPSKGAVNSATFTIAALCVSTPTDTTVNLLPVAGPKGLQNKLAGTSVTVHVTNTAATPCSTPPGPGGDGGVRPAAPAVTNAYLNANPTVTAACKTAYASARNAWRGALIKTVADWMPKPESVKDDTSVYPAAADWVTFVETEVDSLCGVV